MDLIKIGKYIAEKRKALGLTQKQLAEKLNMRTRHMPAGRINLYGIVQHT